MNELGDEPISPAGRRAHSISAPPGILSVRSARQRNGCRGETDRQKDERRNDGPLQCEALMVAELATPTKAIGR